MKIAKDKIAHLVVGAVVAIAAIALVLMAEEWGALLPAALAAAAVGVAYELVQGYRGDGTPDPMDALATAIGGLLVAVVIGIVVPVLR
jgi:hypothetical protein